jgi:branched-chain amino acid transport system permease protein
VEQFLQAAVIGVSLGAQYALLALGFTLIFGILGVVNFAHGGFYMLGGYVAYSCVAGLGLPYPGRGPGGSRRHRGSGLGVRAVPAGATVRRPSRHTDADVGPLPGDLHRPVDRVWTAVDGVSVSGERVDAVRADHVPKENMVVLAVCLAAIGGLWLVLFRTDLGRALRALADDRQVAMAQGMRPKLLFPAAFAIATGLAGLTGALVTPILALSPGVGDPVLATSFLTVILGGLGSLGGAALAAFVVGLVEAYTSVYLGGSIGALVLFVLVLLLLVFRPTGFLGREIRGA